MKIGTVLADRFRLVEPLGRGGMGRVFRALDLNSDLEVAVKVRKTRFQESDTWIESYDKRLESEGAVGRWFGTIRGAPIVHHFGVHEGQSYVVMQLIEGALLTDLIAGNRSVKRRTAVAIACQVGEILDELHRRGFVHRDVKDDNIMIDPEGQVYLLDFGIAKDTTWENLPQGTPGYAPYEQVRAATVTFQSDIYALGCLLCEMVANRLPFLEDDGWNVGDEPVDVPPRVLHRLGPALAPIVLRMVDRDLTRRYATIAEAVGNLRKLLPPPDAPPDPQAPDPDPEAWLRVNPLRIPPIES